LDEIDACDCYGLRGRMKSCICGGFDVIYFWNSGCQSIQKCLTKTSRLRLPQLATRFLRPR
jgi:hypothetical protein